MKYRQLKFNALVSGKSINDAILETYLFSTIVSMNNDIY